MTPTASQLPQSVPTVVAVAVTVQVIVVATVAAPLLAPGQGAPIVPPTVAVQTTREPPTMTAVAVLSPTPSCTPSPSVLTQAPSFRLPLEGQPLDYEGAYILDVQPEPEAEGYQWTFEQSGNIVWDTTRDGAGLQGPVYDIHENSPAHARFRPGDVLIEVRALTCNHWSPVATRWIVLVPRDSPSPTETPIPIPTPEDCRITETC